MLGEKIEGKKKQNIYLCFYLQKRKVFHVEFLFSENMVIFVYIYSFTSPEQPFLMVSYPHTDKIS